MTHFYSMLFLYEYFMAKILQEWDYTYCFCINR